MTITWLKRFKIQLVYQLFTFILLLCKHSVLFFGLLANLLEKIFPVLFCPLVLDVLSSSPRMHRPISVSSVMLSDKRWVILLSGVICQLRIAASLRLIHCFSADSVICWFCPVLGAKRRNTSCLSGCQREAADRSERIGGARYVLAGIQSVFYIVFFSVRLSGVST